MKKTIWAHVSIELDWCDDEEILMDYTNKVLVEEGFTVDDMGMVNPTDKDKFYPEEDK